MPNFWADVGQGAKDLANSSPTSTPGFDPYWQNYFTQGAEAQSRAPVGYDTTLADQARGWQQALMQDLQRQAAGDSNSRAQQSLAQGYGTARAGQSALGSSIRGTGGGAGARAGLLGQGNVQRGYAGDQQMLMLKEQQSAQALLAQQLAQQRAQDLMQAQGGASNVMGNQALDNAMQQFYASGANQGNINRAQGMVSDRSTALGLNLNATDIADRNRRALEDKAIGAGGTVAGAIASQIGRGSGTRYRQVDGVDSIVPEGDK